MVLWRDAGVAESRVEAWECLETVDSVGRRQGGDGLSFSRTGVEDNAPRRRYEPAAGVPVRRRGQPPIPISSYPVVSAIPQVLMSIPHLDLTPHLSSPPRARTCFSRLHPGCPFGGGTIADGGAAGKKRDHPYQAAPVHSGSACDGSDSEGCCPAPHGSDWMRIVWRTGAKAALIALASGARTFSVRSAVIAMSAFPSGPWKRSLIWRVS